MFYWDDWNRDHVTLHGVSSEEAEFVIRHLKSPYPDFCGDGKYKVQGPTQDGRLIQVVFAFRSSDELDYEQMSFQDILAIENDSGPYVYIIHARDLTTSEKRAFTKRRR